MKVFQALLLLTASFTFTIAENALSSVERRLSEQKMATSRETMKVPFHDTLYGALPLLRASEGDRRMAETPTAPFTVNALSFSEYVEMSTHKYGNCDTGTSVDAQLTSDPVCKQTGPCNIGWVEPGESLSYKFLTDTADFTTLDDGSTGVVVNITLRVASYSVKPIVSNCEIR